jgi:hypothetical protein
MPHPLMWLFLCRQPSELMRSRSFSRFGLFFLFDFLDFSAFFILPAAGAVVGAGAKAQRRTSCRQRKKATRAAMRIVSSS